MLESIWTSSIEQDAWFGDYYNKCSVGLFLKPQEIELKGSGISLILYLQNVKKWQSVYWPGTQSCGVHLSPLDTRGLLLPLVTRGLLLPLDTGGPLLPLNTRASLLPLNIREPYCTWIRSRDLLLPLDTGGLLLPLDMTLWGAPCCPWIRGAPCCPWIRGPRIALGYEGLVLPLDTRGLVLS